MAEKSEKSTPAKKKPPARQQMLQEVAETERQVVERREAEAAPEAKLEAKAARDAVAAAEALATEGVVKSIAELKASVGRTLTQLSERLEDEVARYVQVQRAVAAKTTELREIFDIQRSAATLTALIELHDRKREQLETEFAAETDRLAREREAARAQWDLERKQRDAEAKERDAAEQKRRDRDREEYLYRTAREQQQARDAFADEQAKAARALAERTAQAERELAEREARVAAGEQELDGLRQRVGASEQERDAAVARALAEQARRLEHDRAAAEQLLRREFDGERQVLTTRIASLEGLVKSQAEQIAKLGQQAEKAYGQVQEIAVRAIEGSSGAKSLAGFQQLLAEQSRKPQA